MGMNLFARLTKVDEEKRLVYGRATDETVDRSGEIFDYATSKPYFEKWSGEVAKSTDGKSLGNVRAMHGAVAAGKLTQIDFNDGEKAIDVCAKIVDDSEWNKVLEGVYTGFSIGGSYAKTWTDTEAKARRFTADPCEISIVDLPCNPSAGFFDIQKADGSVMQKAFKPVEVTAESFSDEVAALAKDGGLTLDEMLEAIRLAKAKKDDKGEYGDVAYADEKNKKYPIDTEEHIRAAWDYINKEKNADEYSADDLKTIKDKIIAAWKDKIDKDGPPSAEKTVEPVMTKAGKPVLLVADNLLKVGSIALHKGMDRVASLAYLLSSIQSLQMGSAREEASEGDDSTMPDELMAWLKQGGDLLNAMVAEEVAELVDDTGSVCVPDYYYYGWSAAVEGLSKWADEQDDRKDALAKVGARNSAADKNRIQQAHDLMSDLGADCAPGDDGTEKAAHAQTLTKLGETETSLKKLTDDLSETNIRLIKANEDLLAVREQLSASTDERDELTKSHADLTTEHETLTKAHAELTTARDELQKKHDEITVERDDLHKATIDLHAKVVKLSGEPAYPKGSLRAVSKSADLVNEALQTNEEDAKPVLKADGTVDQEATVLKQMKSVHRSGGVPLAR